MDWWGKVRHVFFFGGIKAIAGAEAVGEVSCFTNCCGDLGIFLGRKLRCLP